MFNIWMMSPAFTAGGTCPEYPNSALRWPRAPTTMSPFTTFAMRPLVSSRVLYVDLLVSTSTTTTTPSSEGMLSVAMRTSFDRPHACVTEATLSTTTLLIPLTIFKRLSRVHPRDGETLP